jgi:hypothetical protein
MVYGQGEGIRRQTNNNLTNGFYLSWVETRIADW